MTISKYTIYSLYGLLTLIYTSMIFILIGKSEESSFLDYLGADHAQMEAAVLTTTSFLVFSALLLYSYFTIEVTAWQRKHSNDKWLNLQLSSPALNE